MDVTLAPSAFADVFLACDRIAKPGGVLNSVHSPVTDNKVNYGDLCAKMLAYGFLLLREEGVLDIAMSEKKVLFVKTRFAALQKKAETTTHDTPLPRLLSSVQNGKSARDAVWNFIGADLLSPWSFIASIAVERAQELGLAAEKKAGIAGAFGKFTTGIPKLELAAEKADEIARRIDSCAQRWEAFAKAEPELAEQLVKECYNGIQSRTQAQSPPGD